MVKIDEAMAARAASEGTYIGVLATVPTTLGPTSDLIQAQADEIGRKITLEQRLCEGAFSVLMSGDREKHDAMILEQAMDLAKKVDLIVLAQASMSRLAGVLQERDGDDGSVEPPDRCGLPRSSRRGTGRLMALRDAIGPAPSRLTIPDHSAWE